MDLIELSLANLAIESWLKMELFHDSIKSRLGHREKKSSTNKDKERLLQYTCERIDVIELDQEGEEKSIFSLALH